MFHPFRSLVAATACCLLVYAPALAQSVINPDYPGLGDSGTSVDIAQFAVNNAVARYFLLFGKYPMHWHDVLDCGLYDNELVSVQMQVIDPDDGSLDFPGDLSINNNLGQLTVTLKNPVTGQKKHYVQDNKDTFAAHFERMRQVGNYSAEELAWLDSYENDPAKLMQFAHIGQVNEALRLYVQLHGQAPASVQEFLDSGLSPINEHTINPVTGVAYRFDGTAGDLAYHIGEKGASFTHLDEDGQTHVPMIY